MRILVTGGNGSVGRELVPALLGRGHNVVVLDKELGALQALSHPYLELVLGVVQDAGAVTEVVRGVEAIVHLAWSFSDDVQVLLEEDLRGHLLLLSAARAGAFSLPVLPFPGPDGSGIPGSKELARTSVISLG